MRAAVGCDPSVIMQNPAPSPGAGLGGVCLCEGWQTAGHACSLRAVRARPDRTWARCAVLIRALRRVPPPPQGKGLAGKPSVTLNEMAQVSRPRPRWRIGMAALRVPVTSTHGHAHGPWPSTRRHSGRTSVTHTRTHVHHHRPAIVVVVGTCLSMPPIIDATNNRSCSWYLPIANADRLCHQ